ncbi:MAG: hypothetical protein AAFR45_02920, partial [Pseudomonadota bacterium]
IDLTFNLPPLRRLDARYARFCARKQHNPLYASNTSPGIRNNQADTQASLTFCGVRCQFLGLLSLGYR